MKTGNLGAIYAQMSTAQLDDLLLAEAQKESPDPEVITTGLQVLRQRDKAMAAAPKCGRRAARALRIACIIALLGVLTVAAAGRAQADTLWGRIVRWTDSVIEFFSPDYASGGQQPYEFRTNHPGLQQVQDTLAQLGVTEPVVPMWLPDGYELVACERSDTDKKTLVAAIFQNSENYINFNIALYSEGVLNQFQKDEASVKIYEVQNTEHYITQNYENWLAVWTKENIECSISINCQEDELYRILRSIYDKEEAN